MDLRLKQVKMYICFMENEGEFSACYLSFFGVQEPLVDTCSSNRDGDYGSFLTLRIIRSLQNKSKSEKKNQGPAYFSKGTCLRKPSTVLFQQPGFFPSKKHQPVSIRFESPLKSLAARDIETEMLLHLGFQGLCPSPVVRLLRMMGPY